MLRKLLIAALACPLGQIALAHDKETTSPFDPNVQDLTLERGGPPMLGIHWSREHAAGHARPSNSPNMTYHGGKIMTTAVTQAIFWGSSWTNDTSDKITGLDAWYDGHSNSNYAKAVDEFYAAIAPPAGLGHEDGKTAAYKMGALVAAKRRQSAIEDSP